MQRTRPQLRQDVQIARTGPENFVLTLPGTSRRLLFSAQERNLLRLCDGVHEVEEIGREYHRQFGVSISRRHLREFIEQLHEEGLLNGEGSTPAGSRNGDEGRLSTGRELLAEEAHLRRLNRRFDLMALFLGWILHPLWAIPIAGLSVLGITIFVQGFDEYILNLTGLFLYYPAWYLVPLSLAQTILFLNLPRELLVGMACRRFGGWVRRFGLFWIGGVLPFFYCDRGDLLSVKSERGRWTILLTGLFADMLVGSLMAIGWAMTDPHSLPHKFCLLQLLPWVVGMFLRANIFVPLDGYKILCVIFKEPRIRERAIAETGAWLRWKRSPEALGDRERFWLRCYGLGWHLWIWVLRVLYIVGGIWWLTFRLGGLGALIGVTAVLLWYRHAIWSFFMPTTGTDWALRSGGKWWVRWPVRIAVLAGIIALGFVPYAHEVTGDCWLVPAAEYGVRAQIADEIVQVHVDAMQLVKAGDPIVTFSGRDIAPEVDKLKAELAQAQAQLDELLAGARVEDIAMAEQEVELWRIRLAFAETELNRIKHLHEASAANDDELRQAQKQRDSTDQLLMSSQEKLKRTKQGAREEEIRGARAKVDGQKAKLAQAETKKSLLVLTSPITGRVITPDIHQRLHHFTSPGDLIATVQDTSHMRVEVAADESAALVKPGMVANCRFRGMDGELMTGKVQAVATAALASSNIRVDPVRTDHEALVEKRSDWEKDNYQVLVHVDLDNPRGVLMPGMTGQTRIVVNQNDLLWRAVWRPIVRFFRVDVWSWLP